MIEFKSNGNNNLHELHSFGHLTMYNFKVNKIQWYWVSTNRCVPEIPKNECPSSWNYIVIITKIIDKLIFQSNLKSELTIMKTCTYLENYKHL